MVQIMNEKTSLTELLTDESELGDILSEINKLKSEMYKAQEKAMDEAAKPFLDQILELENIINVSYKMVK